MYSSHGPGDKAGMVDTRQCTVHMGLGTRLECLILHNVQFTWAWGQGWNGRYYTMYTSHGPGDKAGMADTTQCTVHMDMGTRLEWSILGNAQFTWGRLGETVILLLMPTQC